MFTARFEFFCLSKETHMSKKTKKEVLSDYQKKGKRLIPPLMQLPNIVETSFIDTKIPELIWISALFNWADDRSAVNSVIEFQLTCQAATEPEQIPSLSFLSNFNRLTVSQKDKIISNSNCIYWIEKLRKLLCHQYVLFDEYPLSFIFESCKDFDRDEALIRLKGDVSELFDRHSHHATKVQATAVVAIMASGKIRLNKSIDFPDPNRVFDSPDSPEARIFASFARAFLNAGSNIDKDEETAAKWADAFWRQSFNFEGCY